jgi:hypothetical protein
MYDIYLKFTDHLFFMDNGFDFHFVSYFHPWTCSTCMPYRAQIKSPSHFQTLIDNIEMLKSMHAYLDLLLYKCQDFSYALIG